MFALLLWLALQAPYDPPCLVADAGHDADSYVLDIRPLTSGWTVYADRPVFTIQGGRIVVIDPMRGAPLLDGEILSTRSAGPYNVYICAPGQHPYRTYLAFVH